MDGWLAEWSMIWIGMDREGDVSKAFSYPEKSARAHVSIYEMISDESRFRCLVCLCR